MPIGIAVMKNSVASLRRLVWGGLGSNIGGLLSGGRRHFVKAWRDSRPHRV
jgi:hypothetical protein